MYICFSFFNLTIVDITTEYNTLTKSIHYYNYTVYCSKYLYLYLVIYYSIYRVIFHIIIFVICDSDNVGYRNLQNCI